MSDDGPAEMTPETCPEREYHGKPFRYCPVKGCGWGEEPKRKPDDSCSANYHTADTCPAGWRHLPLSAPYKSEVLRLQAVLAQVEALVTAWPDGDERASDYAAARGQCKRAVLQVLRGEV